MERTGIASDGGAAEAPFRSPALPDGRERDVSAVETGLFARVLRHAAARPDAVALSRAGEDGWRTVTRGALAGRARHFAAWLADAGAGGGVVPMLAPKSADLVAAMIGAGGAGAAFAPLNPRLALPQVLGALRATMPRVAVAGGASLALLREARAHPLVRRTRWLAIDAADDPASGERIAALRDAGVRIHEVEEEGAAERFSPGEPRAADDRPGCCLFTSGSTGVPKGVAISRGDLVDRARTEAAWFSLDPDDVLLSVLPLSFDVGLSQLLGALWAGCELALPRGVLPPIEIVDAIRRRGVTATCGVPTVWQDVLRVWRGRGSGTELAPLRYLTISGGSLAPAALRQLAELLPETRIFKTYGQTETFRSTSLRPEELADRMDSVGRAYPGVRLRIIRPDGSPCDPGEAGEVVHAGMGTMLGYLAEVGDEQGPRIVPADRAAGIRTGDHGCLDGDGFLFLRGRGDSMVKIAGNRVYPAEAAARARELPGVLEAEVVAVQEPGQEPVLVCWFVPEASAADEPHRKAAALRMPPFMVPRHFFAVDAIPRLANGKPDLVALRREAAARIASG
jgi:acyl-CoA synthetase (AMP-forming)/AMP-acid ligase II